MMTGMEEEEEDEDACEGPGRSGAIFTGSGSSDKRLDALWDGFCGGAADAEKDATAVKPQHKINFRKPDDEYIKDPQ